MTSNESLGSPYPDINDERLEKLKGIFPEAFTEGEFDIEKLRSLLGENVSTGSERYSFTWAGKQEALQEIRKPAWGTLVPVREESINFDDTENLYIEGENFEVLKLLYKTYHGRIKMIYIDPPYNKDKDFVYSDRWSDSKEAYLQLTGQKDKDGNLTSTNTETAGRRHSNWLSMMYPRLFLARQLLRDDGVIFISIDDTEVANLRKLCDEVFGEENFIDSICWKKKYGGGAKEKYLVSVHEYILIYAKSKNSYPEILVDFDLEKARRFYKCKDNKFEIRGYYRTHPLEAVKSHDIRENQQFPVTAPDGTLVYPKRQWRWSKKRFEEALEKDEVIFSKNKDDQWVLSSKQYLNDENGVQRKTKAQSIIDDVFTQEGTKEIVDLFGDAKIFSFPKPIGLMLRLLEIGGLTSDDLFMDIFAGSSSSANALMKYNDGNKSNCNSIQIQLPETTDEKSEAFKAGYKNIAEIGKERIRRAGKKIKEEQEKDLTNQDKNLDLGFRVFKLQPSHIRKWQPLPPDTTTEDYLTQLEAMNEPLLNNWNLEEVIYEIILSEGLSLTSNIEQIACESQEVFKVLDSEKSQHIYICLDDTIVFENIKPLKLDEEDRFICRDSALDDTTIANLALTCRVKTISEL